MKIRPTPLLVNIGHLFILQFLNYLIPFITFPYLARLFGPEKFGILVFIQSVIIYASTVMDLGTSQNAVREIAKLKSDRAPVSTFFSHMLGFKVFLFVIVFGAMTPLVWFFYKPYFWIYLATCSALIGNALFPVWLFQGLEEMKYITLVNLISRSILTASVFLFVKSPNDLVLAALFQNSPLFLAALISFFVIIFRLKISIIPAFNIAAFKDFWRHSHKIFTSQALGNVYTQGATILLGFLVGSVVVGDYSFANKIVAACAGLAQPVAQGLYPYLTKLYIAEKTKFFEVRKKIIALSSAGGICLSILIMAFSGMIIHLLGGGKFNQSQLILILLSASLTFILLNVVLNSFILAMGNDKAMLRMYASVVLVFLVLAVPMTLWMGGEGMAASILIVEALIFYFSMRMTRVVTNA